MKATILLVDDEEAIRQSVGEILRLEGYEVVPVATGEDALEIISKRSFDLALLDLKMPGIDGIEVLHGINRISPDTKVILLTAHGSMESAIEALRQGAQDYLLKPSPSRAILSSIAKALARRSEQQQRRLLMDQIDVSIKRLKDVEGLETGSSEDSGVIILEDGVMVDFERREIWRGNQRVSLTPTEGKLMKVLLENRGRVLTHRELVFLVQGYETNDWEAPEVLRPLISRLRRKMEVFPNGGDWIVNVRGTGYVLEIKGGEKPEV
jgi:DNA-binding response OmpR family regulator